MILKYNFKELILMSRGKQKSDEQKLQELDNQIAEMESRKASIDDKIKDLKAQKKAIIDAQNAKKVGRASGIHL
jgi:phage shock protein A